MRLRKFSGAPESVRERIAASFVVVVAFVVVVVLRNTINWMTIAELRCYLRSVCVCDISQR